MKENNILDCTTILGPIEDVKKQNLQNFGQKLGGALSETGFINLVNHGINLEKVEKVYKVSKDFFSLQKCVKNKMRKPSGAASFHGYAGPGDELLNEFAPNAANELREFYDVTNVIESNDISFFPSEIQGFKVAFDEFRTESVNLADKLLRCIALYLGIAEDELVKRHTNLRDRNVRSQTNMRSSMYSHLESLTKKQKTIPDDPSIWCGEHCDWHTITLLFQDDIGGLEVKKLSGEWLATTPIQNAVLLMSGDLMEIYSLGRLPATPHRVKIVDESKLLKKPRQSLAFAPSPDGEEYVEPLVPVLDELK